MIRAETRCSCCLNWGLRRRGCDLLHCGSYCLGPCPERGLQWHAEQVKQKEETQTAWRLWACVWGQAAGCPQGEDHRESALEQTPRFWTSRSEPLPKHSYCLVFFLLNCMFITENLGRTKWVKWSGGGEAGNKTSSNHPEIIIIDHILVSILPHFPHITHYFCFFKKWDHNISFYDLSFSLIHITYHSL